MKRPALSADQVALIRSSNLTDTYWSEQFSVNRSTIERARKGETYADSPLPPRLNRPPRGGWKKADIACEFDADGISLPGEEWRPVVGWERVYRVSNFGRIFSLHQTGRFCIGMPIEGGYRAVKLRDGERRGHAPVHCMVLEAFVGPRPPDMDGCHNDGCAANCKLSNLRWDTKKGNAADKVLHGTSLRGRRIATRLTPELVRAIRSSRKTDRAWADELGVRIITILQARIGRTWGDIDTPPVRRRA